jgi:DHA1 family tetracycline resistance protein-like MFS transporter
VLYTEKRFGWTSIETGLSLALVGLTAALVQGGLTRVVIPRLGERKSVVVGLSITVLAFVAYGLANQSWMFYALIVAGSLGGITNPAVQGLISRSVGANEQGGVQGSLAGLQSVAGFLGMHLPGAAFFCGALLVLIGLGLAIRSFRKDRLEAEALQKGPEPG